MDKTIKSVVSYYNNVKVTTSYLSDDKEAVVELSKEINEILSSLLHSQIESGIYSDKKDEKYEKD